jgi:hypothetical protein
MRLLKHTLGAMSGVVVVELEVEAGIVLGCGVFGEVCRCCERGDADMRVGVSVKHEEE